MLLGVFGSVVGGFWGFLGIVGRWRVENRLIEGGWIESGLLAGCWLINDRLIMGLVTCFWWCIVGGMLLVVCCWWYVIEASTIIVHWMVNGSKKTIRYYNCIIIIFISIILLYIYIFIYIYILILLLLLLQYNTIKIRILL